MTGKERGVSSHPAFFMKYGYVLGRFHRIEAVGWNDSQADTSRFSVMLASAVEKVFANLDRQYVERRDTKQRP